MLFDQPIEHTRAVGERLGHRSAQLTGATDPIILSCQKNWHMLFTDGFTNQPALPPTLVGNVDNMVPAL